MDTFYTTRQNHSNYSTDLGCDRNSLQTFASGGFLEYSSVSMGQGQEIHARKLVGSLIQKGGWALLQNCHLGLNFMDELFELLSEAENMHPDFRLWITTETHPSFPINLLQISIKFTNEPPQGMMAGLKRTYAGITQEKLDISNMPQWQPIFFAVSFLHSAVQERRKFGPLGWNIPYEFNTSDWSASIQFIQNHLDDLEVKKSVSWTTVRYMLGEVQYGGRVTDDYDRRLLNTLLKVWFGDNMFQENFEFFTNYKIPHCKKLEEYVAYIDQLPNVDSPQVFGLHNNADITYQSNYAKSALDTIVNIQPKDSSSGTGVTRESVVLKMAEDMLSKVPPDYVSHEVKENLIKMGNLQPLNIFLKQEIDRIQKVLKVVRNTLTELKLAIEGTIIMNENLRDAFDNMFNARVPAFWCRISWESSTLGFWFTELLERNEQFYHWINDGRPNSFWMTGFFNPQGFLTAMRQEVTRMHKGWSLDKVFTHNEVTKLTREDVQTPPQEGVYVYGLFLEGAGWDRKNSKLAEQPAKVLFIPMPVIHFFATQEHLQNKQLYQCPLYKKPQRSYTAFITNLYLLTVQAPEHWILRGVAALCDTK